MIARDSEKIFRLVAENTTDMVSLHALDMRLLFINPSCQRLLGYSPRELEGHIPLNLLHVEDARRIRKDLRRGLERGEPVSNYEVRLRHRDGHYIWFESSIQPIMEGPRASQYVVISRDISERKRADEALRATMAYNQALLRAIPDMIFVLDNQGLFVDFRSESVHRLVAPPEAFLGKPVGEVLPRPVADKIYAAIDQAVATGEIQEFEYQLQFEDSAALNTYEVRLMCAGEDRILALIRDITSRRQSDEALRETQAQLAQRVLEMEQRTGQIILLTEVSNMLQTSITLEEAYEVVAQFGGRLFPDTSGLMMMCQAQREFLQITSCWGDLEKSGEVFHRDDCWGIRRGRSFFNQHTQNGLQCAHIPQQRLADLQGYLCVPIMAQGEAMGLLHIQALKPGGGLSSSQQQIAEAFTEQLGLALSNLQLREKLHEQAIHEPLTGLYNRYYMEESLERELYRAVRNNRPIAIIIMDLDHFKELNTEFGHPNVDQMLREFGSLLKNSVRGGDIACRYGGDEFLVIMPEITMEIAMRRAEQLRRQMSSLSVRGERKEARIVTVSVGVALWPFHGGNAAEVLRAADHALFSAKAGGGNCVVMASAEPPKGCEPPLGGEPLSGDKTE